MAKKKDGSGYETGYFYEKEEQAVVDYNNTNDFVNHKFSPIISFAPSIFSFTFYTKNSY